MVAGRIADVPGPQRTPMRAAPSLAPEAPSYEVPSLARAGWEYINRILSDCVGNISEAARQLGIHRRSLQRKLRKYALR